MNESDDFLRDRLRPGQPGAPAQRPPQPPPRNPRPAPPPAYRPPAPQRSPPAALRTASAFARPSRPTSVAELDLGNGRDVRRAPAVPGQRPHPTHGWRHLVLVATFGLINLGPSARERQEAEYEAAIQSVLRGNYKVGVLGKGGVGKTTVPASVGSILAELRRQDRVVAVDADTAFGRLGSMIDPRASGSY